MKNELKAEARRLRSEKGWAICRIALEVGAAKSSVSLWVRDITLTSEQQQRLDKCNPAKNTSLLPRMKRTVRRPPSKFFVSIENESLTRARKSAIAEAAVQFRLVLHGFEVFTSVSDGDKRDFVVTFPGSSRLITIQVKWTRLEFYGAPFVSLSCTEGHNRQRRYKENEFDFIVGYDLHDDLAYVYSAAEVRGKKTKIAVSEEFAERWDKLRQADVA